ncbi:Arc family DNA-binding protein [Clostridium baratii]
MKKYTLTIPSELLGKIKKLAKEKGMSINQYILLSLDQHLKRD